MSGTWDPVQYDTFKSQRSAPFFDLLSLVDLQAGARIIDLGCGTGELTAELHGSLRASETLGVDSSPDMLAEAQPRTTGGLHFTRGDIADVARRWCSSSSAPQRNGSAPPDPPDDLTVAGGRFDLVFSNAALQWVPDHRALLADIAQGIVPGGQLAVQVPANFDHCSHTVAAEVASEEPFASALRGAMGVPGAGRASDIGLDRLEVVLTPREYACLLFDLGFESQHVRLRVYGHTLDSTLDVVEWTKGTLLTPYRRLLDDDLYATFLDRYTKALIEIEGMRRPYFYAFPRILMWAKKGT